MATTITCDKCGKELTERDKYRLMFNPPFKFRSGADNAIIDKEEWDFCTLCKIKAQILIDNFIEEE